MTLRDRLANEILDIDAEIERLSDTRDRLRNLLAADEADEADGGEHEQDEGQDEGNALPPAVTAGDRHAGNGKPNGTAAVAEAARGRRLKIARRLEAGPVGPAELCRDLDIPRGSIVGVLRHPWFEKTGSGTRDPYRLTEEGRAALAAGFPAGE